MKKMYVQSIIDYVEDNIQEPLNMDIIASHIGYSRFYLHKLFSIYTGMYLMDYVRKRKLAYSLQDLQTDQRIIDIAMTYGFNSSRSYSRAFQTTYGISPNKYRGNTCVLDPKLMLSDIGGIKMLPYLSESKVVSLDAIYALSHKVISKEPEGDVIDFMTAYRLKHNLVEFTEIGFDVPVTEEQTAEGLRGYEYWVVLSKEDFDVHTPDSVTKVTLPKSKYVLLNIDDPFLDPFERITNGWKKLWSDVEAEHTFDKNFAVCGFEEKVDTLAGTSMNIYVPIL